MKNIWPSFMLTFQTIFLFFVFSATGFLNAVVRPIAPANKATIQTVPTIKSPLQLNIKNNDASSAHLTGFTVTYADDTTGKPMTISAKTDVNIQFNHTKSIGFKVKLPRSAPHKFYPFVSDVEINGETISTNYKEQPLGHTLDLLQITQKNGKWVRDVKAMKKANSALALAAAPSAAKDNHANPRITKPKEAVIVAAIKQNKTPTKKIKQTKKSRSSQTVKHALAK